MEPLPDRLRAELLALKVWLPVVVFHTVTTLLETVAVALPFAAVPLPKQGEGVPHKLLFAVIAAAMFDA
jgi:hypothetical protein